MELTPIDFSAPMVIIGEFLTEQGCPARLLGELNGCMDFDCKYVLAVDSQYMGHEVIYNVDLYGRDPFLKKPMVRNG